MNRNVVEELNLALKAADQSATSDHAIAVLRNALVMAITAIINLQALVGAASAGQSFRELTKDASRRSVELPDPGED